MYFGLHVKCLFFCRIFMKLACLDAFSKPDIKFHEDLSNGGSVVPCGRTDRQTHEVANSRFSQYHVRAQKVKYVFFSVILLENVAANE